MAASYAALPRRWVFIFAAQTEVRSKPFTHWMPYESTEKVAAATKSFANKLGASKAAKQTPERESAAAANKTSAVKAVAEPRG